MFCAGMAQLAEQLTCNQQVVGSIPIASSIFGGVPEWPKGADCKSVASRFDGSNPASSTILKIEYVLCKHGSIGRAADLSSAGCRFDSYCQLHFWRSSRVAKGGRL